MAYNVKNAHLPICGADASTEADDALKDNLANPMSEEWHQPRQAMQRSPANAVDFDAYIQANAALPALASRSQQRQVAFPDARKAATLAVPEVESGVGTREDAPAPQGH